MTVRAVPDVPQDDQEVTLDDLASGGDLPPGLVPYAAPKRASRSEVQIAIDERVAEVYAKWKSQGRERVWLRCPHAYYPVPRVKAKGMRDMIRKAGRLHQVQIRFGRTDLYDVDGNLLITFTVVDKNVRIKENAGK